MNKEAMVLGHTQLPSVSSTLVKVARRDFKLCFRRGQELANPLIFFVIVVILFPMGVSPDSAFLSKAGAGVVWVAALLATLLSLDMLFQSDFDDGALEQMVLSPQPLYLIVLVKVMVHWSVTGLPLLLLAPMLGVMMHLSGEAIGVLMLTLALGTPVLSLLGSIGAALTVSLKSGGILVSLLILPLYIPVLIFGTGTIRAAQEGLAIQGGVSILGMLFALALTLAPFATAGALKVSTAN